MSNTYLIESSLMRSIIDKELPNGIADDEKISQMNDEEKKELYQKQKTIIQEFQKKSEQEINVCTSVLRNLNENLLILRKNQLQNLINKESIEQRSKTQIHEIKQHRQHLENPLQQRTRKLVWLQKRHSLNIPMQKVQVKSYKPPFRH
ncbi:hypothetical protein M9Y10_040930 [Tritrichomonas musculus]|uniref:Uncharacterized protein n=1 Tax=Tritrichomonas musculus TaxID=1915356 RepID=A0ABR2K3I8_9EUKA